MTLFDLAVFAKGAGIGAAIAAPVGPMSLLCMRRTLAQGWRFGFSTGTGIACADFCYALVAALGLAGVMRFMAAYEQPLHFAAAPPARDDTPGAASVAAGFGSALALTLTNPPTIVSFVAAFAALAPVGFGPLDAALTAGGVLCGSLLWWLVLTALVAGARHAIGVRARRLIDRVSGAILGLLGAAELRRSI